MKISDKRLIFYYYVGWGVNVVKKFKFQQLTIASFASNKIVVNMVNLNDK